MPLNLGDINFGLGVDTRRLSKSVKDVAKFGQVVAKASSQTAKGSKTAAAALRQQEKAVLSALQQVLKFNQQVRKAGASPKLLSSSAKAFRELTTEMTLGTRSAVSFQRVQSKFTADMGRSARSLDRYKTKVRQAGTSTDSFSAKLRNLTSASVLAVGPLSGVGARITALAGIATRSNLALAGMIGGVTAGGVALSKLGTAAVKTNLQIERIRTRLDTLTGSSQESRNEFTRLQKLAKDTGSDFIALATGFTKVASAAQGTKLQGAGIRQVFDDMAFAAAKFQLEAPQLEGVLRAIEQIMSKGTVQAEELRGQLGDRLPGAFIIAARAMGVTTAELNKMLKAGEVISDEFLPKFAAEVRKSLGAASVKRVVSLQSSIGRLTNATTQFNISFDKTFSVSKAFQVAIISLASGLKFLADNMDVAAASIGGVATGLLALAAPTIFRAILSIGGALRSLTLATLALNVALLANPLTGMASALLKIGIFAVGAVAGFKLISSAMETTQAKQKSLIATIDDYIQIQERASNVGSAATARLRKSVGDEIDKIKSKIKSLQGQQFFGKALVKEDTRNNFTKFIDAASSKLQNFLNLSSSTDALDAQFARDAGAAKILGGEIKGLQSRLNELTRIQDRQLANEEKIANASKVITSEALVAINRRISRLNQQAVAIQEGAAAIRALDSEFKRQDAVEKLAKDLSKAKVETSLATEKIVEFTAAFKRLQAVTARTSISKAISEASEEIRRMNAELEATSDGENAVAKLQRQFSDTDKINSFRKALEGAGVGTEQASTLVRQLTQSLRDLNTVADSIKLEEVLSSTAASLKLINSETSALSKGKKAFEAFQSLTDVNSKIKILEESLKAAGVTEDVIANKVGLHRQALIKLSNQRLQYNESIKASSKANREAAKALKEANAPLERAKALFKGVSDQLAVLQNINPADLLVGANFAEAIADYRTNLEKMGIAQEAVNNKVREFRGILISLTAEEQRIQNITDLYANMQKIIRSGFDSVADSLAESIVKGKFSLSSLADIGRQVVQDLIANFLKLSIIKPIMDQIFSPGGSTSTPGSGLGGGGGLFGGILSSITGLFGRQGLAFDGGALQNVKRMRQGGIISSPTLFSSSSGPAIGGESGTEAIMPLVRNASGNLGVQSMGGSPGGDNTLQMSILHRFDDNGKLESFVEGVSGRIAGRIVTLAAPSIIETSTTTTSAALGRGSDGFDRSMAEFGQSRVARAR